MQVFKDSKYEGLLSIGNTLSNISRTKIKRQ